MKPSTKLILSAILCLGCLIAKAQQQAGKTSIQLPETTGSCIIGIKANSLLLASGSTYRFTVDTREDSGLVNTLQTIPELLAAMKVANPLSASFRIVDGSNQPKTTGLPVNGDRLEMIRNNTVVETYFINVQPAALNASLKLQQRLGMAGSKADLTLRFTAGQRSPNTTVRIFIPAGVPVSMDNTSINVIGRGAVLLKDFPSQSIGRTGSRYSYSKVGNVVIENDEAGGKWLLLTGLDLRPSNGADIELVIKDAMPSKAGNYIFRSLYATSRPETLASISTVSSTATLVVGQTMVNLQKAAAQQFPNRYNGENYTQCWLQWPKHPSIKNIRVQQSTDQGKNWSAVAAQLKEGKAIVNGLKPATQYQFRLQYQNGGKSYHSNSVQYFSGMIPVSAFGIQPGEGIDHTTAINAAIDSLYQTGGGTLHFESGLFNVRTIHLKSNVHLFIGRTATISALKGGDAPETTWFSDRKYRSGLSPMDTGPYDDPENYMTKQDVGHHYFRNTMFFAERENNIRITGTGRITGNGNLVTGDKVMNNAPNNRSDKMFTFKLCTSIEIGGLYRREDLWYDEKRDEPYYMLPNGKQDTLLQNMLHIDQGGHFVLLATGTDNIYVHDTYFGKAYGRNARDIYDFMACNNVTVTNIYSKVSSDDIVKPGSDCSLGFTRPAAHYRVRNVIGDTNCNLFQIGSETADDITDICVDNIYVLGANKAGFSISTNDGATIRDIHLNCGHTGTLHSRSKMLRTFTPFFISISNRARILGAEVSIYTFLENGHPRIELLARNVNIGQVENIILNGIDITEVYGGSSYNGNRWKPYDGKQRRATAIVAGYSLPATKMVLNGLDFVLPNGRHTGYIRNIQFNDVHILVKGSNPVSDTAAFPPELGVGQYNASNLKVQPAYGLWARHAADLQITNCSFNYEETDHRFAIFLDDVKGVLIRGNSMLRSMQNRNAIGQKNVSGLKESANSYFDDEWKNRKLPVLSGSKHAGKLK